MSTTPQISVITPCYNHGEYIREMLDSLEIQTFENFEVIIVNDGSTDNTKEILNNIKENRVKIVHTPNRGPAAARNTAIGYARADYIFNLDADDKIAPSLLEKAYNIITANTNNNIGIVYCDAILFGEREGRFNLNNYTVENILKDNMIASASLFRKEDWKRVGGYSDELKFGCEDWDLWLSIIELGREVVQIEEPLLYYRTYKTLTQSRSGKRKALPSKMAKTLITIFQRHKVLYQKYPEIFNYFDNIEREFKRERLFIRIVKDLYGNYLKKRGYKSSKRDKTEV